MDLKELNHAGEHAIFGSIEVLGDIDGKGMRTIRREINNMQQQQANFTRKIDNYWSDLSNDGIITPVEKTSLLKEWEGIAQSYTALYTQASEKQLTNTPYWLDYADAYEALKTELFSTEKIFNNMYESTTLSDKDAFDTIFSEYYYSEKFVTLAITMGLIDKLGLRALTSLEEEGTNGELAFYHGELYQYVEDTWVKIGTETYLGIVNQMSELPTVKQEGQYFLAGQVFTVKCQLQVNSKGLVVNNKKLMVKYLEFTEAGTILYWSNNRWNIADEDDPRYIAILADYLRVTGSMPALFAEEVQKVSGLESYVGVFDIAPANPKKNYYFLYSGLTVGNWVHARIYKYNGSIWEEMDPGDDGESKYYMEALQDILTLEEAGSGYFSTLFCNAFFTNKASINALKVQTIYLKDTGNIQSEETSYVSHSTGLLIDANGNIDANGDTHIGKTCTIDGDLTINGNTANIVNANITGRCVIGGNTDITGTTTIGENCTVKGNIEAGPLILNNSGDPGITYNYPPTTIANNANIADINSKHSSGNIREQYINGVRTTNGLTITDYGGSVRISWTIAGGGGGGSKLIDKGDPIGIDISFTIGAAADTKTFKLIGIPTQQPSQQGMVWNNNGVLCIT